MADRTPWWVTASAAAIRRLPLGRYYAAHALGRLPVRPFLMRLPARAGTHAFVCDLRDSISREVCFTGLYEPQETQLLERLLAPGLTVIDAGAHWGYFSLLCAHHVGTHGRVLSLEPDPRLMALLRRNVEANGLTQVTCVPMAAAAGSGRARFASFREQDGNWGLSRIVPAGAASDSEVQTIALDELATAHGFGRVDLVKIDVEGAEFDVLRGMSEGLRTGRYVHVLLECHPAHLAERGASVGECVDVLRAAGYRGWSIDHSPAMHRRAASNTLSLADLLQPLEAAQVSSEPWPHLLWCAPGVAPR